MYFYDTLVLVILALIFFLSNDAKYNLILENKNVNIAVAAILFIVFRYNINPLVLLAPAAFFIMYNTNIRENVAGVESATSIINGWCAKYLAKINEKYKL